MVSNLPRLVVILTPLVVTACQAATPEEPKTPAAAAAVTSAPPAPKKHKVVYHLSEAGPDKAKFVMANVQNTITGLGGMANFDALEIVVHGPAVKTFMADTIDADLKASVDKLVGQGVILTMCGNTITKQNIDPNNLVKGCNVFQAGGVVRIVQLEEQGYTYMRP
ncbi:MAG: DsrE family protein [Polyangiaceae bacterium]